MPTPPGPSKVTSGSERHNRAIAASSASRPMRGWRVRDRRDVAIADGEGGRGRGSGRDALFEGAESGRRFEPRLFRQPPPMVVRDPQRLGGE